MAYVPDFDPSHLFEILDTDKDGFIHADDIVKFLVQNGLAEDEFTFTHCSGIITQYRNKAHNAL